MEALDESGAEDGTKKPPRGAGGAPNTTGKEPGTELQNKPHTSKDYIFSFIRIDQRISSSEMINFSI